MQIDNLNKLITRAITLSYVNPFVSLPVIALLSWNLYDAHQTIDELAKNVPIYVVPGALGGRYTAGMSDDVLVNNGRYWTGLIGNFSRKSAADRLNELESYADNSFLVGYQKIRDQLRHEVDQQSQGRSFTEVKDTAKLTRKDDGTYVFTVRGDRTFFSAGIVLYEDQADVEWHFRIGTPSAKNPYGLTFTGVDVREVPNSRKSS
jgi:hypothetical protein